MKIAVVDATVSAADQGIASVLRIVCETLAELGEEIVNIKLSELNIPFYGVNTMNGDYPANSAHRAIFSMIAAEGVVFAAPTSLFGVSALMKAFLEQFQNPQFRHALFDKNCMVLTSGAIGSSAGGIRDTFESMSKAIGYLGGFDAVRTFIPGSRLTGGVTDDDRYIIEKQTEDFYRILRQNRKFYVYDEIVSGGGGASQDEDSETSEDMDIPTAALTDGGILEIYDEKIKELMDMVKKTEMSDSQQADISEITKFFAEKISSPEPVREPAWPPPPKQKVKTCRQMTSEMHEYFIPRQAEGLKTAILLNITGVETFVGLISIDSGKCSVSILEPNAFDLETPREVEVTIITDSRVWMDFLTGKHTAQKAFMTGQLKVRGNFLLLGKLDQFFKKMEA